MLLCHDLDRVEGGKIAWASFAAAVESTGRRHMALANAEGWDGKPKDIGLNNEHWIDPNANQGDLVSVALSKSSMEFRFASVKALQDPLEELDRQFLSQFIAMMRRDGITVVKHGAKNENRRTLRLNGSVTHIIWNSGRSPQSQRERPASLSLNDVMEVSRGAFPGSVAMPAGVVKRCVSLKAPSRNLNIEAECVEVYIPSPFPQP